MNVHTITSAPPLELAAALGSFEEQFTYPLGPGRSFRIDHGDDYPRFFRAMGEGVCFVAEHAGVVLGVLGGAVRTIVLPNGADQTVGYLGDLKVGPEGGGGWTLLQLAATLQEWGVGKADVAFSVVMDGTRALPSRYTGRFGIPSFAELAKIAVLRVPTDSSFARPQPGWVSSSGEVHAAFRALSRGRYGCTGGETSIRSEMPAVWLKAPDGRACGRVEDTRRCKRLIADDGVEMRSAHLSDFAFQDAEAGVELLRVAAAFAAEAGEPALFAAVAAEDANAVLEELKDVRPVVAPATVYGVGFEQGRAWNISTAEI